MNDPSREETESRRQFDMQLEIKADKAAVWKALTDADELCRWFAPEARIDARVGGEVVWNWGDLYSWPQEVEILEPGARLRTRYQSSIADAQNSQFEAPLFVDFFLEGDSGSTTLRVCHSGFGQDACFDEEFDGISRGWPVELRSLRLYLERHQGKDRQIAWSTASIEQPRNEVWTKLLGAQGFDSGMDLQSMKSGDAFELRNPEDELHGKVLRCNPYEFTAIAESHGDAFLRISLEERLGKTLVWIWLACYGQAPERVQAVQERWDAMLRSLISAEGQAANAEGA